MGFADREHFSTDIHLQQNQKTKVMERKITVLDTETTGTDVTKSRIVQIAAVQVTPDLLEVMGEVKNYLINPGVPIPPEATAVHGITDDMVKDAPSFKAYSRALYDYLKDTDIAGFNSTKFDVILLHEEFARVGISWPDPDTKFIDGMSIYHTKERRDLAAAYMFYCNKEHTGAHDAEADILATLEVIRAQILHYDDLTAMTVEELDAFCGGNIRVDLAGTIVLNEQGVAVYNIGKAKGTPVIKDVGFGNWMLKGDFSGNTKSILRKLLGL